MNWGYWQNLFGGLFKYFGKNDFFFMLCHFFFVFLQG